MSSVIELRTGRFAVSCLQCAPLWRDADGNVITWSTRERALVGRERHDRFEHGDEDDIDDLLGQWLAAMPNDLIERYHHDAEFHQWVKAGMGLVRTRVTTTDQEDTDG